MQITPWLVPLLLIISSPLLSQTEPAAENSTMATALLQGRVVDSDGRGVGGIRIEAHPLDPSTGPSGFTYPIPQSSADGSWSWQAPALSSFQLEFRGDGLRHSLQVGLLRPGQTYDLGTQTIHCPHGATFRLVSPKGLDLTRYAFPKLTPSEDGWYRRCSSWEGEQLYNEFYDERHIAFEADGQLPEDYDGSPTELTLPLHSILRVVYPDGTRVVGAEVNGDWKTNSQGEFALVDKKADDVISVVKGEYSIEVKLGEPREEVVRCVMPRGGDVEFELVSSEPVPPPMRWLILAEVETDEDSFCGGNWQTRLLMENIRPGVRLFGSSVGGKSLYDGLMLSGTITRGVRTRIPIPVELSRRKLRVQILAPSGVPAPNTHVFTDLSNLRTDQQGLAKVETYQWGQRLERFSIEANHSKYGYFDGEAPLEDGERSTVILKPWCTLLVNPRKPGGVLCDEAVITVGEWSEATILWSLSLQDEPPWDERSWSSRGPFKQVLRGGDYAVTTSDRGWSRTEKVSVQDGAIVNVPISLPHLRAVTIQLTQGDQPATGEVWLEDPKPEGWTEEWGSTELDAEGRATLYTPALDPETRLVIRHSSLRRWTVPVDGSIELSIPGEKPKEDE